MPRTLDYATEVAPLLELYRRGVMTGKHVVQVLIKMANPVETETRS